MEFFIVTGLSGAGKSQVINALEDMDVYCIDNIPASLVPKFAEICARSNENLTRVAMVTDSRTEKNFDELLSQIERIRLKGNICRVVYLDCSDSILMKRFKETRRKHPLLPENGSIEQAIQEDRQILAQMRAAADYVIDTSMTSATQLREKIRSMFMEDLKQDLHVTCMSFGFKYGVPPDADLVFDVRCLPNPFYVPELRSKTGLNQEVYDYVLKFEQSKNLVPKLINLIDYLLPLYRDDGKSQLVIAFGCTGGKHRSVTYAELMNQHLNENNSYCTVFHRDIEK